METEDVPFPLYSAAQTADESFGPIFIQSRPQDFVFIWPTYKLSVGHDSSDRLFECLGRHGFRRLELIFSAEEVGIRRVGKELQQDLSGDTNMFICHEGLECWSDVQFKVKKSIQQSFLINDETCTTIRCQQFPYADAQFLAVEFG